MKRPLAATAGLAAIVALAVAACSGGASYRPGDSALPIAQSDNGMPEANSVAMSARDAVTKGTATFNIVVPAHPPTDKHPDYISPATKGVSIEVTSAGVKPQTTFFILDAAKSYCSGGTTTAPLRCSVKVSAPAGDDTFLLRTFAKTTATGPVLATGRVVHRIKAGVDSTINLTTYGVVTYLQIALENSFPPTGKVNNLRVFVTAADPWGYQIIGSYLNPITMIDNDTSGNSKLSATSLASSADATGLTLAYNGKKTSPATIQATLGTLSTKALFVPGGSGIIGSPPLLRVAYFTTGTAVRLGGPGTVAPFSLTTTGDAAGNTSCANFVSVSGSGRDFVIKATGNLGTCWLTTHDRSGRSGSLPVLISAFPFASAGPSPTPTTKPTQKPTPPPTATPVPTPTPGVGPVVVAPNDISVCPKSGASACKPFTAQTVVSQNGTPGTFIEGDNCNPNIVTVTNVDPVGPKVRYRIDAIGSGTTQCIATFTGFGGKTGKLLIHVQASGIIINVKPQPSARISMKERETP